MLVRHVNKQFALFVLSIIIIVASVASFAILSQQNQNHDKPPTLSQLKALLQEARESQNVTVINTRNLSIIIPEVSSNISGSISGIGKVQIVPLQ